MDLLASGERRGYLLKSRVTDLNEYVETFERIVRGGSATVEKHVHSILGKLRLPETSEDHRRVLAVITFLEAR